MKVSDKLKIVSESFQVYMYDNGYMIEVSGRDANDDWKTVKLMYSAIDHVHEAIDDIVKITRDN